MYIHTKKYKGMKDERAARLENLSDSQYLRLSVETNERESARREHLSDS